MTDFADKNRSEDQHYRFWIFVAAMAGFLALLKGIRLPNRWSITQAQIDYSSGFVKRGFFGQFIAHPLGLGHYVRFAVFSYFLLALLCALVLALVWRSRLTSRLGGGEMVAVFCACYGISMMASTVGYFDVLLGVLTAGTLLVTPAWWRFAIAVPVCAIALMIHELFLLVFAPALALSFVLQGTRAKQKLVVAAGLLLLTACGLFAWSLAAARPMTGPQSEAMRIHVAHRLDVKPRSDALDVLTLSSADNRALMRGYHKTYDWWLKQATSLLIFGPTVCLILFATIRALRLAQAGNLLMTATITAALSPLLLHAVAWDAARFNGLLCWTTFLTLIIVVQFYDGPSLRSSTMQRRIAACVVLLSLASGGLLMLREDKLFPAYPQMEAFVNQLRSKNIAQIANLSD